MNLNEYGKIISECWHDLTNHYKNIELDCFVIMPNHIHGIIKIVVAAFKPAKNREEGLPTPTQKNHALPEIIRGFKTFSARKINNLRNIQNVSVWQRNYYEHIVRSESDLNSIREYIFNNPMKWELDKLFIKN